MIIPKPEILSVLVQVGLNRRLKDCRRGHFFAVLGDLSSVARQYGIIIEQVDEGWKCSGPKSRLQLFVEKLHFSNIPYQEI